MPNAGFSRDLAAFFEALLRGVSPADVKTLADKVAQHLTAMSALSVHDVDDATSILDEVPSALWGKVIVGAARNIDKMAQGVLRDEQPRLGTAIVVSLLQRNPERRIAFLQSVTDLNLFRILGHALPELSLAGLEVIALMARVDSTMELGPGRSAFVTAYSRWAQGHHDVAVQLIDEWLALKAWSAHVHYSSIAMLAQGVVRDPEAGVSIRGRLLVLVYAQRRIHHWHLALHLQAYVYPEPMPAILDRCSALLETVEKDPLNLAVEALSLVERHLFRDGEAALMTLDAIAEAVYKESPPTGPPRTISKALTDVLCQLHMCGLDSRSTVERLDLLVGFPLLDSQVMTRSHHHTLDPLLATLWEKEPVAIVRFLEQYLVFNSEAIRDNDLTLEFLFCGLAHAMGPQALGQFLIGLVTNKHPYAREIGSYLLELSLTQRLPPVEISIDLLRGLSHLDAEVVILELTGRATSGFYIPFCLHLLSLQPELREGCTTVLVNYFASDYPGACRKAKEKSGPKLDPGVLQALDVALESAGSHHNELIAVTEIFSLVPFAPRWNKRTDEIMKARHDDHERSGRNPLLSIMKQVHLARGASRWGTAGDPTLHGTKGVATEFEGSRLYCASPLRYQTLRQRFLLRSQTLLHPEEGT